MADLHIQAQVFLMSFAQGNLPHVPSRGEVWVQ